MTAILTCLLQVISAIYTGAGSPQLNVNILGIITVLVTFALCMVAISNIIGVEQSGKMLIIKIRFKSIYLCLSVYTYIQRLIQSLSYVKSNLI